MYLSDLILDWITYPIRVILVPDKRIIIMKPNPHSDNPHSDNQRIDNQRID